MDRTFRLVWNDSSKTLTMAESGLGGSNKRLLVRSAALAAVALSGMLGGPAFAGAPAATALPTGAQVAAGQVAISTTSSTMNVVQASPKAIINWQSFDVGANAAVNFSQSGPNAVALNRVLGQDPSAIYGKLTSNGQVFLINPNGVLFAPGAQVNIGGLVASTLNISDESFLSGNYRFTRNGSRGAVVNQGDLTGGYVALLGSQVTNGGIISAPMGTVALASGNAVTLGITGEDLVSVQVDKASIDTLVQNNGLIEVAGGVALLSAQSATDLLGQVVNTGEVSANGIESDGGVIRLTASSSIDHSGILSADAGADGKGGSVSLIAALDNPASITRVSGAISARGGAVSGEGGSVETSATHLKIADTARVDTTASYGATGSWLLDPYDFTIAGANGDITGAALSAALESSDVTIATADTGASCTGASCGSGSSTGNGDINVNDAVSWGSTSTLTLSAWNNVNINAPITVSGSGGLALEFAQSDVSANFPFGTYTINAPVNLAAGAAFSTKAASDGPTISYTVITDATSLAALASNLGGNYVLGGDVDLSSIASWTPLGTMANPFAGYFDGLDHQVMGLTHVNSGADTEVGLFGASLGQIQNVGVTGANVAGSQNVGALVGFNNGAVVNSYATGSVTGSGALSTSPVGGIGGLVGYSAGPIFQSYADVTVSATSGDQSSGSPLGTFVDPHGTGGIGGLAGVATSGVTSSYATGAVTGNQAVGGLVGYSAAAIQSTYSTGRVTGATVNTVAATNVGGLIGQVDQPSSPFPFIFSSFWDVTTSGQSTSAEGLGDAGNVVGLTTSQMQTASTFTGDWITSGAWELRDGQYPLLKQMLQPIFVIADNKTTTYNASAVTGFLSTISPSVPGSAYSGTVAVTPSTADPTNAGSYTLTASGLSLTSPGDQHGYRLEYVDGALTIDPATLTYTIAGELTATYSKTYDGSTAAEGLTSDNFLLSGWQGTDSATVTKTSGVFDNANAGTGKTITVTLTSSDFAASSGTDLSNYVLPTSVTGRIGTINAAPLSVTVSKTYDGSDSFTDGFSFTGMVGDEAAPTATGSATVSSANAATYTSFATNNLTLSDSNYTLDGGTVSATINPAVLGVTVSKTYDGNDSFNDGFIFTGMVGDEAAPTATGSATVSSANAATYDSFAINHLTLSNSNYTLDGGTVSATIDPAVLGVTVSKTYDGSDSFTDGFTFTGMVGGEAAPTATGSATVSSANAATYDSFAINHLTLSNSNYTLDGGTVSATIAKKALDASLTGSFSKTYDRSTAADGLTSANFQLDGWAAGEGGTVTKTSGEFDDWNAGTNKTVTVTLSSSDFTASNGTLLSNYILPTGAQGHIGTILQKDITASATADNKVYNAKTDGSGTISFTDVLEGDDVSARGATWTFDNKNAGTNKLVTITGATLSGADAGNYSVTLPTEAHADISKKQLTATFTVNDKVYDGNTKATGTVTLDGVEHGDVVSESATWAFSDKNADTNKIVTFTGATLTGDDMGNYVAPPRPSAVVAAITPKALGVTVEKVYNGDATFSSGFTLSGVVDGDAAPTVGGSATVLSANAATYDSFAANNLTLSNSNYTLDGGSVSATISPKALTASLTGEFSKTYDRTVAANGLTSANFQLHGWVGEDGATVTKTSGEFGDWNAGTNKTITVELAQGDFAAQGHTKLSNYVLPTSAQGDIGTITPKALDALTLSEVLGGSHDQPEAGGTDTASIWISISIPAGTGGLLPEDGPLSISQNSGFTPLTWDVNGVTNEYRDGGAEYVPTASATLHAGEEQKLTLSGAGASNYTLTGTSVSAKIEGSHFPVPGVLEARYANLQIYQQIQTDISKEKDAAKYSLEREHLTAYRKSAQTDDDLKALLAWYSAFISMESSSDE